MGNELVTVITPVHNCGRFVSETVQSVLNQKGGPPNYIVIDDASTDGFKLKTNEYFKLIRHKVNKGEQASVNEGLALVNTKYFMIVNADDPLYEDAISTLVAFMEANPHILCAYPDYSVIGEDSLLRRQVTSREYDFKWMVQHHTWLPSVGSIFRSSLIGRIGYRKTCLKWLGDAEYWLRIGLEGPMAHVPATLACWRKRNGQASSAKSQLRAVEHIKVLKDFYKGKLPQYLLDVKGQAFCWAYLVAATVTSSKLKSIQYGLKALFHYPLLLVDIKFWDIFIKRALFILRR